MDDEERAEWVENDEGLYDMKERSGLSTEDWVRKNRALIDANAKAVTDGTARQHSLKYGA